MLLCECLVYLGRFCGRILFGNSELGRNPWTPTVPTQYSHGHYAPSLQGNEGPLRRVRRLPTASVRRAPCMFSLGRTTKRGGIEPGVTTSAANAADLATAGGSIGARWFVCSRFRACGHGAKHTSIETIEMTWGKDHVNIIIVWNVEYRFESTKSRLYKVGRFRL